MTDLQPINEFIDLEKTVWVESQCRHCGCDLSGKVFERFYKDLKTNPRFEWINGKLQDICEPCRDMFNRNKQLNKRIYKAHEASNQELAKQLESQKDKRIVTREHVIYTLELHGFEAVKRRFKDYEYTLFVDKYIDYNLNHLEWLERIGFTEYIAKKEEKELLELQYAGVY